jgi:hypothetical protein
MLPAFRRLPLLKKLSTPVKVPVLSSESWLKNLLASTSPVFENIPAL